MGTPPWGGRLNGEAGGRVRQRPCMGRSRRRWPRGLGSGAISSPSRARYCAGDVAGASGLPPWVLSGAQRSTLFDGRRASRSPGGRRFGCSGFHPLTCSGARGRLWIAVATVAVLLATAAPAQAAPSAYVTDGCQYVHPIRDRRGGPAGADRARPRWPPAILRPRWR